MRIFPVKKQQFPFSVAADEFEIVVDELTGENLLDMAARRDIAVTAQGQLGPLQMPRRQGQGAHELLDERYGAAQSRTLSEFGEDAVERMRFIQQYRLSDFFRLLADRTAT